MPLQISDRVRALAAQAQAEVREQFDRIDAIAEENSLKVLSAFQKHRVAEGYFAGTTGYGYDDLGRDKLEEIYADIFGTEDALVRIGFVNGTHAIACALFGALKPGMSWSRRWARPTTPCWGLSAWWTRVPAPLRATVWSTGK